MYINHFNRYDMNISTRSIISLLPIEPVLLVCAIRVIYLSSLVPPSIQSNNETEQRWVAQGNNISLTCDAEAIPPPSISWLMNGEPLEPTLRVRAQSGGRILFISNAQVGLIYF